MTFLDENLIYWKSKRSGGVATSTTVAELESVYMCLTHMIWECDFLRSLGLKTSTMTIYNDNMALINILNGEKMLDRTKFVAIKVEFIREKIRNGDLYVVHIKTNHMRADMLTKSLGRNLFHESINRIGMENFADE